MNTLEKVGIGAGVLIVLTLIVALFLRITFVNFVDNYEFGYKFDALTGEITPLNQSGYIWSAPFITKIHTIDTRPFQVAVGANNRVLNAKLVQFNPKGYKLFIAWHGRDDYHIDSSSGAVTTHSTGLTGILASYAFDPSSKSYPFLTVLKELKNEESVVKQDTTVLK